MPCRLSRSDDVITAVEWVSGSQIEQYSSLSIPRAVRPPLYHFHETLARASAVPMLGAICGGATNLELPSSFGLPSKV